MTRKPKYVTVNRKGDLVWIIYNKFNYDILYIGLHKNEEDVWKIYLGWPGKEEIEHEKDLGSVASQVFVAWNVDKNKICLNAKSNTIPFGLVMDPSFKLQPKATR